MREILMRARQMILRPKELWLTIKAEPTTIQELIINYAAPLALIPSVANLIGFSIVGIRMPSGHIARAPFMEALSAGVVGYIFHLGGLFAGAWAINVLGQYFNSKSDFPAALKLVVYAMTPVWLLGVFSALPAFGILQVFGAYSIYLLYLGFPVMMETPKEKVAWYTFFTVIASILISLLLTIIVGGAIYGPMFMRMMAL